MRRSPAVTSLASALSLAVIAVACSRASSKRFIPPPPATVATITTAPPGSDLTGISLAGVEGRVPAVSVAVTGGDATLAGLVTGPDGPVGGATIRLERFVGDAMARLDIVSNADGTWRAPQLGPPTTVPTVPTFTDPTQLPTIPPPTAAPPPTTTPVGPQGILGGRYRIRAWRTPDLALTTPQILFLEGKQARNLGLQLSRYQGASASAITSPDPPLVDAPLTLTAIVTSVSVNSDGVVSSVPLPNAAVSLTVGGGFTLTSGPTVTNAQGRASFLLRCQATGQSSVDLTVNSTQTFTLPVRPCVAPPSTTTTLFDPGEGTTSSSTPGSRPTSTNAPPST